MTIFFHELRRGKIAFAVWTCVIVAMLIICMAVYPEMKAQMKSITDLFSALGVFTAAFGMDQVNFGEVMGFYAIECGNILSIGGGFYAALLGILLLSKEEKEHTAEFLLTHPVSRVSVALQKWFAAVVFLVLMNVIALGVAAASFSIIGETVAWKEFLLLHSAFLVMQIELASVCFGISAFVRGNSIGIGLGLAAVLYFLNLIAKIAESAEFLKYITPFGYADASDIVANSAIDGKLMWLGLLYGAIGLFMGVFYYSRKDITA